MPRSRKYDGTIELIFGGRFRLVTWQAHGKWNVMVVDKNDSSAFVGFGDTETLAIAEGRRWAMKKNALGDLGDPVKMSVFRRLR